MQRFRFKLVVILIRPIKSIAPEPIQLNCREEISPTTHVYIVALPSCTSVFLLDIKSPRLTTKVFSIRYFNSFHLRLLTWACLQFNAQYEQETYNDLLNMIQSTYCCTNYFELYINDICQIFLMLMCITHLSIDFLKVIMKDFFHRSP